MRAILAHPDPAESLEAVLQILLPYAGELRALVDHLVAEFIASGGERLEFPKG